MVLGRPVLLSLYNTKFHSKPSLYWYLAQILISCADMHLQHLTTLALLAPITLASYTPAIKEGGHNEGQVCPEFTHKYVCSNNKKHVVSFYRLYICYTANFVAQLYCNGVEWARVNSCGRWNDCDYKKTGNMPVQKSGVWTTEITYECGCDT
jgi:hypothetical protein